MRKYNIDAYRNLGDLKLKVLTGFEYNNLLLTCYDTALLWLQDLHKNTVHTYPDVTDVNLMTLADSLAYRAAFLKKSIAGYDRLYFKYELVYRCYENATKEDLLAAITTLDKIVQWWYTECRFESLIELFEFQKQKDCIKDLGKSDTPELRKQIAEALGLKDTLETTRQLLESSDE